MTSLVVYDSQYGNTKRIAEAIQEGLASMGAVAVKHAGEVTPDDLRSADLLVIGCPTQRFRPTAAVRTLLGRLPAGALGRVRAAAFDTRMEMDDATPKLLRFLVRLQGEKAYAAKHLATSLSRHGATLAAPPEGFIVTGMEGPLGEGELERASRWGHAIVHEA
jgi:flavodoxin